MRIATALSAYLFLVAAIGWGQLKTATVPDEIFYNGKVITVDAAFTIEQSFAVRGGEILAVGSNAAVRAMAGPATRLTDLHGHAVIPGLMDDHSHQYNVVLTASWGTKLSDAVSLTDMIDRLRDAAAKAKKDEVVVGAAGWSANNLAEKRPPNRKDLDQASIEHPIVVFQNRGTAYLNTAALRALGITKDTPALKATPITRDSSGEPTGELSNAVFVNTIVRKLLPPLPLSTASQWLLKVQQEQNAMGLTSIRDLDISPAAMRAYYDLWRQKKLTMRVSMGLDVPAADWNDLDHLLSDWGVGPGFGDHWLRMDSISEFALDSRGSGLFRGLPSNTGRMRITPDQLTQAAITMNRYGWRPAPHIEGDLTLDHVLAAYEAANAESSIKDKRWVVEHIPYVNSDQIERMARLGIVVSAQIQARNGTAAAARLLGNARAERMVPMREMLDHKLIVSTGSDWLGGDNNNPFENIYFYVTRKAKDGTIAGASQKISREEAIRVSTINNAYLTFEEDVKGSLEAGKLADFVILSDDIMTVPEEKLLDIKPLATYVGGRKVYSASRDGF